ncbi:MAG: hypothetical protein FWG38_05045, partial [Defluviitaleaceae bacterium]|nr:hypothetical protein [Defluviitaleaceae bacterium]
MKITGKPCLALDALAAITFCNICRGDIPYVKEQIDRHFAGITIPPANAYFDWLIEKYPLADIETFTLAELAARF